MRILGITAAAAACVCNYLPSVRALRELPAVVRIYEEGDGAVLNGPVRGWITTDASVAVASRSDERLGEPNGYHCTYFLFERIPVKTVRVVRSEPVQLYAGGRAIGITIRTDGVLVVGLGAVDTDAGALSPGTAAGLRAGDVISEADGVEIEDAQSLAGICEGSDGSVELTVLRESETLTIPVPLVREKGTRRYRLGVWVRDSTAGIGTLSFVDGSSGWFAALGHPVSDLDTQSLLTVRDGRVLSTQIVDVHKGEQGSPGELIGVFSIYDEPIGYIERNTEYGIFGPMADDAAYADGALYPMGYAEEAYPGGAELIATVDGGTAQAFSCEILRVNEQSDVASKGMVIRVTDERLLSATGGIVQGMSGCPVIQDGKLIGVVTHVFVNDPTRGYCIYAEWMRAQITG